MFLNLKCDKKEYSLNDYVSYDCSPKQGWAIVSFLANSTQSVKEENEDFEIVQAYYHSAEILAHELKERSKFNIVSIRDVGIPFLFLCRHTAELAIKFMIKETKTNIEVGNNHRLLSLWKKFVEENKENIFKDEKYIIERIARFIEVLDKIDEDGLHFRYATSNKGKLYREAPFLINIDRFIGSLGDLVIAANCLNLSLF